MGKRLRNPKPNCFWRVDDASGRFWGLFQRQEDADHHAYLLQTEAKKVETHLTYRQMVFELLVNRD